MASNSNETTFTVAPANPDEMGFSRPDDFSGVITSLVYVPYRFSNSTDGKYYLNARVGIQPDEDSGLGEKEIFEYLSAGFLNSHAPSPDLKTLAGDLTFEQYKDLSEGLENLVGDENDFIGYYAVNFPNSKQILPDGAWKQFLSTSKQLTIGPDGVVKPAAAAHGFAGFGDRSDTLVGMHFHFNRILETKDLGGRTPKKTAPGEKPKEYKVLCPTELLEPVAGAKTANKSTAEPAAGKTAGTTAGSPNAESDEFGDSLEMTMKMEIEELGANASKKNVNTNVLNALTSPNDKKNALNNYLNKPWATAAERPWEFVDGVYRIK